MRDISKDFQNHIISGVTNICRCWRIQRTDGTVLGFSDHDDVLEFADTIFEASAGMTASALQSSSGLSADNAEAQGALSSDLITSIDIKAGLYDDAIVWHWLVNWADTDQRILMFKGALGEIKHGPNAFQAELRSQSDKLNKTVGRTYLKTCSAILGDTSCKVNIDQTEFTHIAVVRRIEGNRRVYLDAMNQFSDRWFVGGQLIWETGANSDRIESIQLDINKNSQRIIEIKNIAAFDIEIGDRIRLIAGCDKRAVTCKSKFNNIINFQGFPFIPGDDWATAYPISGGDYSGQSLAQTMDGTNG